MRRFDPYPITINGSRIDELVKRAVEEGIAAGMIDANRRIDLLRASNRFDYTADASPPARAYESRVFALLSSIARTEAGQCLYETIKEGLPIWIAPYDTSQAKVFGSCNAITGHAVLDHSRTPMVRVAYSYETWAYSQCGFYPGLRADEVLFHEMVHAYRFASPAVPVTNSDPLPDNKDFEEFFANQVTNVYRSTKNARTFNRDYLSKRLGTAAECEEALWSKPVLVEALQWFLEGDPLALAMAKINTSYNPFARIDHLVSKARSK